MRYSIKTHTYPHTDTHASESHCKGYRIPEAESEGRGQEIGRGGGVTCENPAKRL